MSKRKKVLITGSNGYIAKNLTKYLADKGFVCGGFDKKDGICASRFTVPKKNDLFAIVHLAATASIPECEKNVYEAGLNNIIAAANMFQQGLNHDIPIIFTSSQAAKTPNSSTYASTKRYAECYAQHFNLTGGRVRILRLCNVYGGENFIEDKSSVVAKFLRAKRNNEPLIVNGDGSQTRDFIHVDDVCEAIYLSMYNDHDWEEIVDIGTGKETSILELAEMLKCDFSFNEKSANVGVKRNVADMKNAEEILSFNPNHSLEQYLSEVEHSDS